MRVKFKATWFAPTAIVKKDKIQSIGGKRYRPGVYELSDDMKDQLPSSAEILEGPEEEPVTDEKIVETLRDHDVARSGHDEMVKKLEEADKTAEDTVARRKKK